MPFDENTTFAAGRVITGFSLPYVALYKNEAGTNVFTNGRRLARGVNVEVQPDDAGDDNVFSADNRDAEAQSGKFTGGNLKLTVDGLFLDSERFINGLPEPGQDGWTGDGDSSSSPYVATGYIVRWMSKNITGYTPYVIPKTKYSKISQAANTQEGEEIDWQTTELNARILRDDTTEHNWRYIGDDFSTEEEAETALKTKLGIPAA